MVIFWSWDVVREIVGYGFKWGIKVFIKGYVIWGVVEGTFLDFWIRCCF